MFRAKYEIIEDNKDFILLDNIDSAGKSITNDAENIIEDLIKASNVDINNKLVYYIDTEGRVDILKHNNIKFTGFKFGFNNYKQFIKYYYNK
jgi:phage protein D